MELERRIKNLERASEGLLASKINGDIDPTQNAAVGDADQDSGVEVASFSNSFSGAFDSSAGFSDQQVALLASLSAPDRLKPRAQGYQEYLVDVTGEVVNLKAKNAVLGENYRRMVMACTGWSAEQVDDAAEGLTQCVKELNDNPVPEDEAIEILMRDRGQDW